MCERTQGQPREQEFLEKHHPGRARTVYNPYSVQVSWRQQDIYQLQNKHDCTEEEKLYRWGNEEPNSVHPYSAINQA